MFLNGFPFVEIFVPVFVFFILLIICGMCKAMLRNMSEEQEYQPQSPTSEQARPSIFIVPVSQPEEEEDVGRLPRYSTVDHYNLPPSYDELELKSVFIPHDPPPSYSESISSPPASLSVSGPTHSDLTAPPQDV